jgi:HK97 family phage prohead protease
MNMPVAPMTKHMALQEFKAVDEQQGTFEGYLSVFGNIDSYKDIVEPGAFQKTIKDARSKNTKYLFPLLWQHDPKEPIGGFLSMEEDGHGLRVVGQIDTSTNRGQQAYSGLKMGYLDGLSIGYDTIKHKYTGDIRHLLELRMWEGSVVTFPANTDTRVSTVKSACGSIDLPLADRTTSWNGAEAEKQIHAWADNDENKLRECYLWTDGKQYKLPFVQIEDNHPVAIPKAIETIAAILEGSMGGADLGDSESAVKTRVETYYHRMSKTFKDPSLVPPWDKEEEKKMPEKQEEVSENQEEEIPEKQEEAQPRKKRRAKKMAKKHVMPSGGRDFSTIMDDRQPDELTEELYDLFGAMMTSLLELFYHTPEEDDIHDNIEDSLDQFNEAVLEWVDEATDCQMHQDYHHSDEDDDHGDMEEQKSLTFAHFCFSTRAMKQAVRSFVKEGRTLSSDSRFRINSALDGIDTAIKDLQRMLEEVDADDDDNEYVPDDEDDGQPDGPSKDHDDDYDDDLDMPIKPNSHQKSHEQEEDFFKKLLQEMRTK